MANRVKCNHCEVMILEQTALDNEGLCAPCFKRARPSPSPYELQLAIPASQLDEKQKRAQLQGAIQLGNTDRIHELISDGTRFLAVPPSQFHTWLGEVIAHGSNLEVLEKLAVAGCDPNSRATSPDQTTPLEVAVHQEQVDAIEWLLKKGADPNIGRPIVAAVNPRIPPKAQLKILALLLAAGAEINKSYDLYGNEAERFTVLDWALMYENAPSVIEFLEKQGARRLSEL